MLYNSGSHRVDVWIRQLFIPFMAKSRYGVISSIESGGTPQSALVGVAITPELEIVFDTLKTTQKIRQSDRAPSVRLFSGGTESRPCNSKGSRLSRRAPNWIAIGKRILPCGRTVPRACPGPASLISLCDRDGFAIATSIRALR